MFVFSAFSVMWLSLVLQTCTIAATAPVESSTPEVVNVQVDTTTSGLESVDEHDECPSTSVAGDCCCGTSGINKGTEASKRNLLLKKNDDRFDSFTGDLVTWTAPESIFVVNRFATARPAEALPAGPPIYIRNCVYLI